MPSKLPKVNFVLGEDELELVRSYQKQNGIKSLSKAFVELVSMGIRSEERRYADEDKLINAYRLLDDVGKSHVLAFADWEVRRCEDLAALRQLADKAPPDRAPEVPEKKTKIIKLIRDVAAGPGVLADIDLEDYEVPEDSYAEYAIKVNGYSMEPYLHDGEIALGVRKYPKNGEIGTVYVDGEYFVKQFCKDVYENIYLFSLNRKEKDMRLMTIDGHHIRVIGTIPMSQKIPPLPEDINL